MGRHGRSRRAERKAAKVINAAADMKATYERRLQYLTEAEQELSLGGESLMAILEERDSLREVVSRQDTILRNFDSIQDELLTAMARCHDLEDALHQEKYNSSSLSALLDNAEAVIDEQEDAIVDQRTYIASLRDAQHELRNRFAQQDAELSELRRARDAVKAFMSDGQVCGVMDDESRRTTNVQRGQ